MPKLSPELLRAIWERALTAEIGIAVKTNNPKILRHQLTTEKNTWPDADKFSEIMTAIPEGKGEVFLVRKTVEVPDATS